MKVIGDAFIFKHALDELPRITHVTGALCDFDMHASGAGLVDTLLEDVLTYDSYELLLGFSNSCNDALYFVWFGSVVVNDGCDKLDISNGAFRVASQLEAIHIALGKNPFDVWQDYTMRPTDV